MFEYDPELITEFEYAQDFATDFMQRTDLALRESTLTELRDSNEKFEVIDIAKFSDCVKTSSREYQGVHVCTNDKIHSKFQTSIESMKLKVKTFIDSSQGKVSIILFDLCIESNLDKDCADAISFPRVVDILFTESAIFRLSCMNIISYI